MGKDLRSGRCSPTLPCVRLSSDGLPRDLPQHPPKSQFPTFPTLDLALPPSVPQGALSAPPPPVPGSLEDRGQIRSPRFLSLGRGPISPAPDAAFPTARWGEQEALKASLGDAALR